MLINDSINTAPVIEEGIIENEVSHSYQIRHPYQVLRTLPKDATPAQQDSAIQAVFQPGEIRYSERPDTLHIPGHPAGKSIYDVNIPQFYNETYFKNDSLYHSEISSNRLGLAGDPITYKQRNDDFISGILFVFILFVIFSLSRLWKVFISEMKKFFAPPRERELRQNIISVERILQILLSLLSCVSFGLIFFNYTQENISQTFILPTEYHIMGIFCAEITAFFILMDFLYLWVNKTLFSSCDIGKWNDSKLFLMSLLGVFMLQPMLLNVYFDLNIEITLIWSALLIILYEILVFFKAYNIFFKENAVKLQIFLYLCTLEYVPLLIMWGILVLTANKLTIKY